MAVAYFQIAVIVSIVATWLLTRKQETFWLRNLALVVALVWTVETLILVFTIKLVLVQFFTIWGTWLVLQKLSRQEIRIKELESAIQKVLPSLPPNAA